MNVRYNNNALAQLNDCIKGLLHLGPNVVTFRTLLQLGHLGLQQEGGGGITRHLVLSTEIMMMQICHYKEFTQECSSRFFVQ